MFSLIYLSKEKIQFDADALQQLAARAQEKNLRLEITGYLYYRTGTFIQYLEGEEKTVQQLMDEIEKDERHHVVKIFTLAPKIDRAFPNWQMRFVTTSDAVKIGVEDILGQFMHMIDNDNFSTAEPRLSNMISLIAKLHR